MNRSHCRSLVCLALLVVAPAICRGAGVLSEVPSDALGIVLIHNLSSADGRVAQIASLLGRNIPQPLAFLKEFAGISEGINPNGDLVLALFPASNGDEQALEYCVWLPISDYDRFLGSLNATSIDGVAAATIAGEDLLVARRGDWALIMDPEKRERLAQLATATPSTPHIPPWSKWIEGNDVTAIAYSPGVRALQVAIAAGNGTSNNSAQANGPNNNSPFNPNANRRTFVPRRVVTFSDVVDSATSEFYKWLSAMPELSDAMHQATVVGCGLRIDANGNALASVRMGLYEEATKKLVGSDITRSIELPNTPFDKGGLVFGGGGRVPQPVLSAFAKGYAHRLAADLKEEEETDLDETSVKRLLEAIEPATADVQSVLVLDQPGDEAEPVYTNSFVVVRVDAAGKFMDHAKEVVRLWNSANRSAKGDTQLILDVEDTKVGEIAATQYSLDVAALEGGLVLPDVRQAMEKLFGPGGKLRLWLVPVDEHSVLLASATAQQVATAIKGLGEKHAMNWNREELREANALLPADADWRMFFDPHRYYEWDRRKQSAMTGAPIIGGPLGREFAASPPIGVAGGFRQGELWIDLVALAPTVKNADAFFNRYRARAAFQLRARVLGPAQPVPVPAPVPKK